MSTSFVENFNSDTRSIIDNILSYDFSFPPHGIDLPSIQEVERLPIEKTEDQNKIVDIKKTQEEKEEEMQVIKDHSQVDDSEVIREREMEKETQIEDMENREKETEVIIEKEEMETEINPNHTTTTATSTSTSTKNKSIRMHVDYEGNIKSIQELEPLFQRIKNLYKPEVSMLSSSSEDPNPTTEIKINPKSEEEPKEPNTKDNINQPYCKPYDNPKDLLEELSLRISSTSDPSIISLLTDLKTKLIQSQQYTDQAIWIPFFHSEDYITSDSETTYSKETCILKIKVTLAGLFKETASNLVLYPFGKDTPSIKLQERELQFTFEYETSKAEEKEEDPDKTEEESNISDHEEDKIDSRETKLEDIKRGQVKGKFVVEHGIYKIYFDCDKFELNSNSNSNSSKKIKFEEIELPIKFECEEKFTVVQI